MFGKKKDHVIRAIHYEGLKDFSQDYPCTLELKDGQFIINKIKPDTTVTLDADRILAFDPMEEKRFMLKYHNDKATTHKAIGIKKFYLVVRYKAKDDSEQYIAFWGTASEYGKFLELQKQKMEGSPSSYEL